MSPAEQDALDAARWRALLASPRLRILGTAGFGHKDNYRHFGLEAWSEFSAQDGATVSWRNADAIQVLTEYADVAIQVQKRGTPRVG
jgi:hypothetical protein